MRRGPCLAAATETLADGTESHVVWIASNVSLLNDQYNQQVSGANQVFSLNCMGWTCEKEEGISIHAKTMTTEYLTMSASTASLADAAGCGSVACGYLAFGLRIWIREETSMTRGRKLGVAAVALAALLV